MNANDINILLQLGERITFECKKAEGQIPKSVWETYSSFANTIGGTIMLGIKEYMDETSSDKRFEITGVANPQKMRKEFFDTLNSNKVNRNILTDADVEIIQYQGYDLLCIHVPQADYRQRPMNMGGYIVDRNTRREGLTLAGLLMFGKGLPIRERFDNIRMDYLDMTNLQPDSRWSDRLTYDGRWENNLYNFFMRVQSKLVSDIKRPFRLEGMERIDDTAVHKAIREALTNLVIHADYMVTGVLKVEKHDDCFVFSNPGTLKIPVMDIYAGGNSKARNPNMQSMLRMIGFGDNIGSGFPTILNAWKKENWRKPFLVERTDLHLVELTLSMVSLIPEECHQALNEVYGSEYNRLDKECQLVLATAITEDNISNYRIQQLLGKNPLEAGRILYALVDKGMLLSNNRGRWTSYSINSDYSQGVKNSRSKTQGVKNSRSKTQGVKSKEQKKKEIRDALIAFCREARTLQEIADYLGYADRNRMKRVYIDPILGELLEMTSSESKNSPNQKYITKTK